MAAAALAVLTLAAMAGTYGLAAIPLRWVVGWLGDTFGRKRSYMLAVSLEAIGLCFFAFVTPDRWWLLIPFFLTFGIGHAGWLVMQQTLIADFFGSRRFATLRGIATALQAPVAFLIPLFMGSVFDARGGYTLAILAVAGIAVSGAKTLVLIRRPMWIHLPAAAPAAPQTR